MENEHVWMDEQDEYVRIFGMIESFYLFMHSYFQEDHWEKIIIVYDNEYVWTSIGIV